MFDNKRGSFFFFSVSIRHAYALISRDNTLVSIHIEEGKKEH